MAHKIYNTKLGVRSGTLSSRLLDVSTPARSLRLDRIVQSSLGHQLGGGHGWLAMLLLLALSDSMGYQTIMN